MARLLHRILLRPITLATLLTIALAVPLGAGAQTGNSASAVEPAAQPWADLTVESMRIRRSSVGAPPQYTVRAKVRNEGNAPAFAFYVRGNGPDKFIGGLYQGSYIWVTVYSGPCNPSHMLSGTVIVDPTNVVPEWHESNNRRDWAIACL